jgi:hypothetical protein
MKVSRRAALGLLVLGFLLALGILFRSFIQANLVRPIALVLWALMRVVQSVDQKYYWGLLIVSAVVYTGYRLIQRSPDHRPDKQADMNTTLENVKFWRSSILFTCDEIDRANFLKSSLGNLLAAVYAAKQPDMASLEIYTALKQRQVPLPEAIYNFLFPEEQPGPRGRIRQILHAIGQIPRKIIRRWTRRDVADYYRSIEQALAFMESTMEMENEDGYLNTNQH